MSCKVKKQESPEYYTVVNLKTLGSHLNLDSFKRDVNLASWQSILSLTDPINAWEAWKGILLKIADLHAPKKTRRARPTHAPCL